MIFKSFVGQAYQMESLPISAQRCVNWYIEGQEDPGASSPAVLQPTPGYKEIFEIDDPELPEGSFCRGIYRTSKGLGSLPNPSGSVIVVMGPGIYWIKDDYSWQKLGIISNLVSRVSICDDGFGVVFADGAQLYRLDIQTVGLSNTAFGLTSPTDVVFFGGYTIAIGRRAGIPQNVFFWSGLYDNSSWDPLDYASAEMSADPVTGIQVSSSGLYLFGPNSYEVWNITGDSKFPLQKSYSTVGAVGLFAPRSLTRQGTGLFFLGTMDQGNASAYMTQGVEAVRISTLALEQEWNNYDISDCTTWTYGQSGHEFVVFNFDAANKTYVYDVGQKAWHERASRQGNTDTLFRWEPNYCIQISDTTIVGDRNTAKFYELSPKYSTENGRTILRIRTTAHINSEQEPIRIVAVRFDMETGRGITNEDPARYTQPPTVMFRYSQDRGFTWSSELRQTFGRTGDYLRTVEYTRLGVARNFTVEFKIADPCRTTILGAYVTPEISPRGRMEG